MTGAPPTSGPGPTVGWVDALSRVVVQVGFPVVVAGVLLWFLLTRFESTMTTITERMQRNMEVAGQLAGAITAQTPELQRQSYELGKQTEELRAQTALLQRLATAADEMLALGRQRHAAHAAGAAK
jgi:hypothetical protein